jgi:hypothetical protein
MEINLGAYRMVQRNVFKKFEYNYLGHANGKTRGVK